jgi:methylthioribulose-1-phosphate dehydratase
MRQAPPEEAGRIVEAARFLAGRGWAPATAGNFSHRLADGDIAITVSGAHKAWLSPEEVMVVDAEGNSRDGRRPSAETALHLMAYRIFADAQAVLHTHSIPAVVVSRRIGETLRLEGYELLKAFPGVTTHETAVELPVFDNSQDIAALAVKVAAALIVQPAPAFVIRDHGLYGWGTSMAEAIKVVEAAETLIAMELEQMQLEGRA